MSKFKEPAQTTVQFKSNKLDKHTKNSGICGKFWGGNPDNIILNIAGIILMACAFMIVIACIVFLFFNHEANNIIELIKIVIPVVTLVAGYLFGKGGKMA